MLEKLTPCELAQLMDYITPALAMADSKWSIDAGKVVHGESKSGPSIET
jgi:hypothetical protein